jgi:hypothetical protein
LRTLFISLAATVIMASCNKKKDPPPPVKEPDPVITPSECRELPPVPEPFGWQDSTNDEDRNVNAFIVNPANANEIICVVNGNANGYNKLIVYDVPSKTSKYLATLGSHLPSVNQSGWIVFNTSDYNIFKIKASGDSLSQLTFGNVYEDPRWDHTGKYIYYFVRAWGSVPTQVVKANANGAAVYSMPLELPHTAPFKASDQIIYSVTSGTVITLIQRNIVTQLEKTLISGPYSATAPQFYFDDLTLDKTDENFYWSNDAGIFKCNLATLKTDTLLKNCPNIRYSNPIISFNDHELTFSKHILKPLDAYRMYHEYKAIEMNLQSRTQTEIRIFQ